MPLAPLYRVALAAMLGLTVSGPAWAEKATWFKTQWADPNGEVHEYCGSVGIPTTFETKLGKQTYQVVIDSSLEFPTLQVIGTLSRQTAAGLELVHKVHLTSAGEESWASITAKTPSARGQRTRRGRTLAWTLRIRRAHALSCLSGLVGAKRLQVQAPTKEEPQE
jgi:hypothetical protein